MMIQSSGGSIMRAELIEKIAEKFKVCEATAKSAIDHCKNFLIEEHLKAKGSPVKLSLKVPFRI
jgi:nucleoid DNA-binding protein